MLYAAEQAADAAAAGDASNAVGFAYDAAAAAVGAVAYDASDAAAVAHSMILLSCRPWTMLCRPLREVACSGMEPFVTVNPGDAGDAAVPLLAFDARNRSPMVKFPLAAYRWQTVVRQHCLFQRKYGHSPDYTLPKHLPLIPSLRVVIVLVQI